MKTDFKSFVYEFIVNDDDLIYMLLHPLNPIDDCVFNILYFWSEIQIGHILSSNFHTYDRLFTAAVQLQKQHIWDSTWAATWPVSLRVSQSLLGNIDENKFFIFPPVRLAPCPVLDGYLCVVVHVEKRPGFHFCERSPDVGAGTSRCLLCARWHIWITGCCPVQTEWYCCSICADICPYSRKWPSLSKWQDRRSQKEHKLGPQNSQSKTIESQSVSNFQGSMR